MNQRLTVTGNRILAVSRRLSRLPRTAPVPHAFASLLTDPADSIEEAWRGVLSHSDAEPALTGEPVSNAESADLKAPQYSFRPGVSLPQPRFQHRHGKTPVNRQQHIFENLASSAAGQSGVASASENLPPATLSDATFRGTTVQGIANKFSLKPETNSLQAVHPKASPSEAISRKERESGFGSQVSEGQRAEIVRSVSESLESPEQTKNDQPHSTRLTRSSTRLAAVLNANLRTQTEQEQSSRMASTPGSMSRTQPPLNIIRHAATKPTSIAATNNDPLPPTPIAAENHAPSPPEAISSPTVAPQIDRGLIQSFSGGDLFPSSIKTETAAEVATPAVVQLPTVEAILEELYERLRVEFLRTYGSSGG